MKLLHALNVVFLIKFAHGDAKIYFAHEILQMRGLEGLEQNEVDVSDVTTEDINLETTSTEPSKIIKNVKASCPDDAIWCDAPEEYPEEQIMKAVIKQKQTFKDIFDTKDKSQDFISLSQPSTNQNESSITTFSSIGIASRISPLDDHKYGKNDDDDDQFKNICGLTTSYIKPRAAKNKDGEYRFIVNHPDGADEYLQVVRVSTCNSNDEQCGGGIIESAGLGLETKCQQEFSDHKLVALSATGEELVVEEFRFPTCCTCMIREKW